MDLYATDYGKRICLACGARLGERDGKPMQHLGPPREPVARAIAGGV